MDQYMDLPVGSPRAKVEEEIRKCVMEEADLMGQYSRNP